MSITLQQIKSILDSEEISFQDVPGRSSDRPALIAGWDVEDDEIGKYEIKVVVLLEEQDKDNDGFDFIQIRAIGLTKELSPEFHKLDKDRYIAFLQYLAYENYTNKIGTWSYDPSDGDLYLCVALPVEDATVTAKQFLRLLMTTVKVAKTGYRDFRRLHAHGDASKPIVRMSQEVVAELAVALATNNLVSLVGKLGSYKGSAEALVTAARAKNWDEVRKLLDGPTEI